MSGSRTGVVVTGQVKMPIVTVGCDNRWGTQVWGCHSRSKPTPAWHLCATRQEQCKHVGRLGVVCGEI